MTESRKTRLINRFMLGLPVAGLNHPLDAMDRQRAICWADAVLDELDNRPASNVCRVVGLTNDEMAERIMRQREAKRIAQAKWRAKRKAEQ